ncbi:receptor-interacting serine/threonine-protein kinase 1-like isoform X1 [Lethenteron reissneri]|uniref:receptor-interacting serine/threonine-protein kinase 1-like isoform X1 n=1 Tax=Lethenteron reissneri TaxID=7753 RepID=UPI002AB6DA3A|nr:receptor-interacting serine/threonine-protein kinase 1-like isoform X1 [Lethenteron reissneri]XP_061432517.1 receptor-interacting serine/threonine-protein kinase 1-like isoform X1 [Lethenteron reissneri]
MSGRSRRSMHLRQVEIPRAEIEIDIDGAAIGQGGFGIVLLGQYKGAKVAVKQVSAGSMDLSMSCLRDEAKILVKLRSKFIVSLLGVVLEGGCSLVLEYMAQGNLLKFLQKWQTAIGWSLRGRLVLQVLKGMSYLHAHNIVHQDLKPENVLLDNGLNAKLSDFGTSVCKTWTQLTRMETQQRETAKRKLGMGTLAYMAPERLGSLNRKVDEKMDVYSFAILTWVILTNKEPYESKCPCRNLRRHRIDRVPGAHCDACHGEPEARPQRDLQGLSLGIHLADDKMLEPTIPVSGRVSKIAKSTMSPHTRISSKTALPRRSDEFSESWASTWSRRQPPMKGQSRRAERRVARRAVTMVVAMVAMVVTMAIHPATLPRQIIPRRNRWNHRCR